MTIKVKIHKLLGFMFCCAVLVGLMTITVLADDFNKAYSISITDSDGKGVGLNSGNGYYLVNGKPAKSGTLGIDGCTAYYDASGGVLYLYDFKGGMVCPYYYSGSKLDNKIIIDLTGMNSAVGFDNGGGIGCTFEITSSTGGKLGIYNKKESGHLYGISTGYTSINKKGSVILSGNAFVTVNLNHTSTSADNYAVGIYANEGIVIKDYATYRAYLYTKTTDINKAIGLYVANIDKVYESEILIDTKGDILINTSNDASQYSVPIKNDCAVNPSVKLNKVGEMTLVYKKYGNETNSSPKLKYDNRLIKMKSVTGTNSYGAVNIQDSYALIQPLDRIDIRIKEPVVGESATDSSYKIISVEQKELPVTKFEWQELVGGKGFTFTGTFQPNTYYYYEILLERPWYMEEHDNYYPSYVNGENVNGGWVTEENGEEYIQIYDSFKTEAVGGNTVSGTVTSYNSDTDDITVQLIKSGTSDVAYETTVKGNSTSYSINDVAAGTYTMKVTKKNHVAREYTVTVSGDTTQDAKICLRGDVDNNGKVNMKDLSFLSRHFKGISLTGYQLDCGDIDDNGKVNMKDLSSLSRHFK